MFDCVCITSLKLRINKPQLLAMENYLSKRGVRTFQSGDFLGDFLQRCIANPWSKSNPNGYLNYGTSENYLCDDILIEKFNEPGFYEMTPELLHYYQFQGSRRFRNVVAQFIDRYFNAAKPIDPENLFTVLGSCDVIDTVAHSVGDPGDVFLCPSPYYTRIHGDLYDRSFVSTYDVPLSSKLDSGETKPFHLTLDRLQRAYEKAKVEGNNVRGIVLMNPNNPLGCAYSEEELMPILNFSKMHKLWVLMDEIYALNMTDNSIKFQSIFSYKNIPDPQRTVWVWSLSKDLCSPGLRVSFAHTSNEYLSKIFAKLSMLQAVPSLIHTMVEKILSNYEWLDTKFFPTMQQRMAKNYKTVTDFLAEQHIEALPVAGGLFIFANFSGFLKDSTFEAEHEFFEELYNKHKVYLVPGGQLYCTEPGWFRMVFTVPPESLIEGLTRLKVALDQRKQALK